MEKLWTGWGRAEVAVAVIQAVERLKQCMDCPLDKKRGRCGGVAAEDSTLIGKIKKIKSWVRQ